MSTPSFPFQDQLTTMAEQGQEAAIGAVRTWAEAVQRLSFQPGASAPDVSAVVDNAFELAERLLETQRELTKNVLRAVASSTADATDATAQTVAAQAEGGARTAPDPAAAAAAATPGVADSTSEGGDETKPAAKPAKRTRSKPTQK